MIMGEPNCQTARRIKVESAYFGVEIQAGGVTLKMLSRMALITPSPAKSRRQSTAMATEPPSRVGR
jgi:hypothetical protein